MQSRLGILRIGIDQKRMNQVIGFVTLRLLIIVVIVALIGIGISYILAFMLNKPIVSLINGVKMLEKGDLKVNVKPLFNDEIGKLTVAFNHMSDVLGREKLLRTKLTRKLITSQEEERQRISRELHDTTSQSLTSIKIGLKILETDFPSNQTQIWI